MLALKILAIKGMIRFKTMCKKDLLSTFKLMFHHFGNNEISFKGTPSNKTKSQTTYRIITELYTQDNVNATSYFEFQVDISFLATASKELATLP